MLFCQQCGAENSGDARFCNQCGSRIASAGEPGGPLPVEEPAAPVEEPAALVEEPAAPPKVSEETLVGHGYAKREAEESAPELAAAPPAALDASTISLSAIGVRSPAKAWGLLVGLALFLIGLGAIGTWIVLSSGREEEPRAAARTEPSAVEVGDPIPEGAEIPDVDFVTGAPRRTAPRERPTPTRMTREAAPPTRTTREATSPTRTTREAAAPARPSRTPTKASHPAATSNTPARQPATSADQEPDWEQMEEEDDEMEEYSTRVRSVIRSYYARRAQTCFEHESRNNEEVRGTVLIDFRIQANGNVDGARVARNTTGLDSLGACLANQVNGWRLPPPPEAPLSMQMPFSR